MIVSCDYSIRKFADSKNFTGALIDKFRANGYNCSNIAAIAGPQCSFCDLSRCYALRHSFFTKSIPLMYNLKYLDVSWTSINNVECIADCLVLRGLNLSGTTQIVDYSGLSTLTTLQLLALRASNVGSIDFCSELLELRSLDIGYTAVNDLTPVAELTRLEELLLDHSGSKSRAYMLKNGFSWDDYLIHTTEEIMDTAEIPAEGSSITDGSLGRESGAEGDAEGVVLSARPESGEAPHVVAAAVIRQHSTGNISQLGDEDDSSGELHNENHDNDKSILSCSSTKSVPLRSGPSLAEAEALEDTDQLFIVSNLKLIHDLTHREHANLRVINANYTELGVEYYDSCLEAVHEDVCLEKHSLSHKLVEAIVHNNVDAARRFLQGGVYINERVGPWINDYFADIWHSTRGGADIPAVKSYGGFIGTPTHTTRDKRIHGTIPFFNCNHENIDWRPTYLHIALLFNTREILQLLVMMGADLGAQVWFSYIKFDMDNVVYTDAEVRHQLELQNRGPIKEGSFVFNPHTLAKEIADKVVHRHTELMIDKKISNFKKLCNYFYEVNMEVLNGNTDEPPPMPEIRLTSGAGIATSDTTRHGTAAGGGGGATATAANAGGMVAAGRPSTTSNIPSLPAIGGTAAVGALATSNSNKNLVSASATKATKSTVPVTAVAVAAPTVDDVSLASSDWSRMVGITLEADESVVDAFPGANPDDGSVVTMGSLITSNSHRIQDAHQSGLALQNVNTVPVSLFSKVQHQEYQQHGGDDDCSVGTTTSDFSSASSIFDPLNPASGGKRGKKSKKKAKNMLIESKIDVQALQKRISCLFWRNHDMVLKLTSTVEHIPMDSQVVNHTSRSHAELLNQQYICTKSGKVVTILGKRNYFLEQKAAVIAHATMIAQEKWDKIDADRFENALVFDGKMGILRKIKPKAEPDEVRRAKFEDDIMQIHEQRLESQY